MLNLDPRGKSTKEDWSREIHAVFDCIFSYNLLEWVEGLQFSEVLLKGKDSSLNVIRTVLAQSLWAFRAKKYYLVIATVVPLIEGVIRNYMVV